MSDNVSGVLPKLYFCYPAYYRDVDDKIEVAIPDLGIEPFTIDESQRSQLFDIAWELAAKTVGNMLANGEEIPKSVRLEDLEISPDEDRDAFLIELQN